MDNSDKLTDEEKFKLIAFYENASCLWDSTSPNHANKKMKAAAKDNLFDLFDGKYGLDVLEVH